MLEAAEIESGNSEWASFHDEDKWELGQFLMKNLGQTKIDEMLKLSFVSEKIYTYPLDTECSPVGAQEWHFIR